MNIKNLVSVKIARPISALIGLSLLTACGNYPFPSAGVNTDGSPRRIWYQALQEDPRTLDPQIQYDNVSNTVLANITVPLYEYSFLQRENVTVEPALADGLALRTRRADGGETYTIKIKKNILFADDPCFKNGQGREITSDDFIYSLKRIADPNLKNPTSSPIFPNLTAVIIGFQEFYDQAKAAGKTDYSQSIKGVEKVDRYTFRIHLNSPYPQLKYFMAMTFFAPTPIEAVTYYDGAIYDGVRRDTFKFHPVGAGPYKLGRWQRNQSIELVKNENYTFRTYPTVGQPGDQKAGLLADAGKPLPLNDGVYFPIVRESIPVWTLFRQGYIDGLGDYGRGLASSGTVQQVVSSSGDLTPEFQKLGIKSEFVSRLGLFYYAFNLKDPVVGKNKKLRQALAMAYTGQRYIDLFYDGTYLKPETIIPPGIYGHDKSYKNPYGLANLDQAKQLLKEAGYANGIDPKTGKPLVIEFVLQFNGPPTQRQAQFLIQEFQKIGVKVEPKLVTFSEIQDVLKKGRFQVTLRGWLADYPDPENFLILMYSKAGTDYNAGAYNNPEYDRLFDQVKIMENTPERKALIDKMINILNEDAPLVYMYFETYYTFNQSWTDNAFQHPISRSTLQYRKVDTQLRTEKQQEWNQPNLIYVIALAGVLTAVVIPVALNRRNE